MVHAGGKCPRGMATCHVPFHNGGTTCYNYNNTYRVAYPNVSIATHLSDVCHAFATPTSFLIHEKQLCGEHSR